jgi:hypothetical protein
MDYIAVIDYEHLDNGVFLTSLARSLARQENSRGIIIHGESAYTERLIQTGMMREDAVLRAIRDLNHRLIALFADQGVAAIGLNGYQKSLIQKSGDDVVIDKDQFQSFPSTPHLLISNLIDHKSHRKPVPLDLPVFAESLQSALNIDDVMVFSLDDSGEIIPGDRPGFLQKDELTDRVISEIPDEFNEVPISFRLTTAQMFAGYPSLEGTTYISREG